MDNQDDDLSVGQELVVKVDQLPANVQKLAKFVLVGREKLVAVRASIRAIDKLNLAKEVRDQKLEEADMLANALLDAETRLGDLLPTPRSQRNDLGQLKAEKTLPDGITKQRANDFRVLAANKDIVEQVKEDAQLNDELPTRTEVLRRVKQKEVIEVKPCRTPVAQVAEEDEEDQDEDIDMILRQIASGIVHLRDWVESQSAESDDRRGVLSSVQRSLERLDEIRITLEGQDEQ